MSEKLNINKKVTAGGGRLSGSSKNFMNKIPKNIFGLFFVFILILIGSFVFTNKASAATFYVSNTTSNGYTTGNDTYTTTQAQNKNTPWLTLNGAENNASTGDIIYVNAGTYLDPASYWQPAKGIAWITEGGTAIVQQAGSLTKPIFIANNSNTASWTGFTFDAKNVANSYGLFLAGGSNKIFINDTFINSTINAVAVGSAGTSASFTNSTFNVSSGSVFGSGDFTDTGSTFNLSGTASSINLGVNGWGQNLLFTNSIFNAGSSRANLFLIKGSGTYTFDHVIVNLNSSISSIISATRNILDTGTITFENSSIGGSSPQVTTADMFKINTGIWNVNYLGNSVITSSSQTNNIFSMTGAISGSQTFTASNNIITSGVETPISLISTGANIIANIHGNTITKTGSSGYTIAVGTEITNQASCVGAIACVNDTINSIIDGNIIYGPNKLSKNDDNPTLHAIFVGHNKDSLVTKNLIVGSGYGIVIKHSNGSGVDSNTNVNYNILLNNRRGLLIKGQEGVKVHNNTIVSLYDYAGSSTPYGIQIDDNGGLHVPINTNLKNNIIYLKNITGNPVGVYWGIALPSGFITDNNLLFLTNNGNVAFVNFSLVSWSQWQGLNYDLHGLNVDPFFTSSSNFKLLPTSPAINTGTNVSLTSDYLGNPIVGTPDIGAYEFQAPTIPTSLSQYKANGTTAITSGTFTNEDNVVLKFNMSSSEYNSSDLLTPQVEIQELATPFTNTVTNSGDPVVYSGSDVIGIVAVTGLTSGKTYHWQARISNPATQSSWVAMGGSPDFQVDTTAPLTPTTTPSAGTYNSTQSVTLSATGSDYIKYSLTETPATCSAGTLYSDSTPISIATSQTIYARACDNTGNFSTQSFVYIIDSEAPSTAIANPVTGTYSSTQSVTLTATGSDSIRYSTTETPATCSSGTLYTTPISVSTSQTIYVRACDTLTNFSTTNFVYVISRPTSSGSTLAYRNNFLAQQQALTSPIQLPAIPPTITPASSTPLLVINRILKISTPRMWGDDILTLQTLLNTKGYDSGTPDGNFGPKTQVAVIAFQKANGLTPDGSVGSNTLKYLNGDQTTTTTSPIQPTVTRILKLSIPRMIGDDVKTLQTYLSEKGYDVGTPDGIFGIKTKSAILAFQTANGLTPDGIVGAKTLEMMK